MASFDGTSAPSWLLEEIVAGLGGVSLFAPNVESDSQVAELVASLRAARHDATSLVVAIDEEGGDVTRLDAFTGSLMPGAGALGAVDDVAATEAVYRTMGRRLGALGINLDLAPCADVNVAVANPVIGVRSFSADPATVARHVAAAVRGLQSVGIGACAKHFPGHGATVDDSHLELPVVGASADTLRAREFVPFAAAIGAGTAAVMTAHIVVPGVDGDPATRSRRLLGILRNELGFAGVIVSDALDMAGIHGGDVSAGDVTAHDIGRAAVAALAAGCDLVCLGSRQGPDVPAAVVAAIVAAVERGELSVDRLEAAAKLTTAMTSGLSTASVALRSAASDEASVAAVAERAVTVTGRSPAELAGALAGALVVDCRAAASMANVGVSWGLGADVVAIDPTGSTLDATPTTDAGSVLEVAAGRPLVVAVRSASAHPWQRRLVADIAAARPDAVVVELGWPDEEYPATVTTWGASRASTRAVAHLLVGKPVDR